MELEIVKMELEWLCIHKPVVMSFLNQKVFFFVDIFTYLSFHLFWALPF